MSEEVLVARLLQSFDELDRCIEITKAELAAKGEVSEDVLSRVEQYGEIVNRQRSLAEQLEVAIHDHDATSVSRLVKVINGLSVMIRDDAQSIIERADQPEKVSALSGNNRDNLC
ncbi:MAG: hypothetical protein PHC51_09675 [bacterium]|nr:hypothetical protein [bacterium]